MISKHAGTTRLSSMAPDIVAIVARRATSGAERDGAAAAGAAAAGASNIALPRSPPGEAAAEAVAPEAKFASNAATACDSSS